MKPEHTVRSLIEIIARDLRIDRLMDRKPGTLSGGLTRRPALESDEIGKECLARTVTVFTMRVRDSGPQP